MLKDLVSGWRGAVAASLVTAILLFAINSPPDHEASIDTQDQAGSVLAFLLSPDMLLVYFTAALFVVGVATYITFKNQADIMNRTLNQMQRDSQRADDQFVAAFPPDIEIIRAETLEYVPVPDEDGLIDTAKLMELCVVLRFVNRGRTDAVTKELKWTLARKAPESNDAFLNVLAKDLKGTVLTGGEEGTQEFVKRFGNANGSLDETVLHFAGYIWYQDRARKWHKTGFHLRRKPNFEKWEEVAGSSFNYRY